jgi:hypothetical protein
MKKQEKPPPFVGLTTALVESPAWIAASPYCRCLYIALKALYRANKANTTNNNGSIFLGQRAAAAATGLSRPTIAYCFPELVHYGFIVKTKDGCLGSDGNGVAPHWKLPEVPTIDAPATMDFLRWNGVKYEREKKRKDEFPRRPRPKNRIPANGVDHPGQRRLPPPGQRR